MKNNTVENPEMRIIQAANKVFLKYGVEAATMMQIADEAGISRTSLHYYYRSKQHLFAAVFSTIESKMIPALSNVLDSAVPVLDKVSIFVDEYIQLVVEYPMIPGFLSSEMQRNPKWMTDLYKRQCINFDALRGSLEREANIGLIRRVNLEDLIANIFGMCVFPILSKPLFMEFVFEGDEQKFVSFMQERKKVIKSVLNAWLRPVEEEVCIN